jgi:hypothetical protein
MKTSSLVPLLLLALIVPECQAFLPPSNSPRGRIGGLFSQPFTDGRNSGDNGVPPSDDIGHLQAWDGFEGPTLLASIIRKNDTDAPSGLRGGGDVVKGTQATLSSTGSYWAKAFQSFRGAVVKPLIEAKKKVANSFKSKEVKKEEELLHQLKNMPIQRVVVPNSTVLPNEVIQLAANRAGVVGHPLQSTSIQSFAKSLKEWYIRKGYILHSVTGATLQSETGTAIITVQEPAVSKDPVGITFCKEMVVDEETGNLLTFRQYKDKHQNRRTLGFDKITKADLNTTFVPTAGHTRPNRIASALGLSPGNPFQWDGIRWQQIASSGIFAQVLRATPQPMQDGTVQLHILATEAPTRHLEYGLGKSLYTGSWEGELDFEHINLLGGGESLGLSVRRGTKDAEPSIRLSFTDSKFGLGGGYDLEVFSDFIGDQPEEMQEGELPPDYDHDSILDRKGATVRLRNPICSRIVRNSVASGSLERTATKTGLHETIGSTTLAVGPFVKRLPYDARSSIDAKCSLGTRLFAATSTTEEANALLPPLKLKPYTSATATTRQIFPLLASFGPGGRPLILALKHSITTATPNLPRHEAKAQGIAHNIRGSSLNGRVASALTGTTELRVPIDIPVVQIRQDTNVVFFGDWLFAAKDSQSSFRRKSCVGVGVRKSVQGIPLKYDLCYSSDDGKFQSAFGLGADFDF